MNLSDFLKAVANDLLDKAKGGATDIGYEAAAEAMIVSYRKFCVTFAKQYLYHTGTDHEVLKAFRERFVRMLKLSVVTLDEIDTYLVGKYVDRRGKVLEIYMDVPKIRKEIRSAVKFKKKDK